MTENVRVHIASSRPIGEQCAKWAHEHLPANTSLVENMNECTVFFSVLYNKLIPEDFIAPRKCFNFHAGILPFYRGSGTINWAIINGEKETGVTLHEIDGEVDHGPVIDIKTFPLTNTDTAESVFERTEKTIIDMFQNWFVPLVQGNYTATPQDHTKATLYTRKQLQDAKDLTKFARAYHLPGYEQAYYLNQKGEKKYLEW